MLRGRTVKVEEVKKVQRLVALRNVDKLKDQGWKVVKKSYNDVEGRELGVKTHASDLTLMEK